MTFDQAQQLAARYGLTLCEHCEQPREMHTGCDHGRGVCLVARDWVSMVIRYPEECLRADVISRLNQYADAHAAAEELESCVGAGV